MKYKIICNLFRVQMKNKFDIMEPMILIDMRYFPPGFSRHQRAYQAKHRMAYNLTWKQMRAYLKFLKEKFSEDLDKDEDLQKLIAMNLPKQYMI